MVQLRFIREHREVFVRCAMQSGSVKLISVGDNWSHSEVDETAFKDASLGRRFSDLLCCLSDRMEGTIPLACQDWASTKAAYRFFSNPKV